MQQPKEKLKTIHVVTILMAMQFGISDGIISLVFSILKSLILCLWF